MARDSDLKLLASEFRLWGVKFTHQHRGNNHIELRWQVSPDKEVRSYFISHSGSDHRGWLKARADIRRLFRADGLTLKEEKKPGRLAKALAVPEDVEPDHEQIKVLRAEVADLTELVIELTSRLDRVIAGAVATPVAPSQPKPSVRSIRAIDYVSTNWNSTEAIARDMGLTTTVAYRKLFYLKQQGVLEMQAGRWRKAPKLELVKTGGAAE